MANAVTCLLCNRPATGSKSEDNVWLSECPTCGEYEWSGDFATLVKRARSKNEQSFLQDLERLALIIAEADETLTLTPASYPRIIRSRFAATTH